MTFALDLSRRLSSHDVFREGFAALQAEAAFSTLPDAIETPTGRMARATYSVCCIAPAFSRRRKTRNSGRWRRPSPSARC